MDLIDKYDGLEKRFEKLSDEEIERICNIAFPCNEDDKNYLVRLFFGEDIDASNVTIEQLYQRVSESYGHFKYIDKNVGISTIIGVISDNIRKATEEKTSSFWEPIKAFADTYNDEMEDENYVDFQIDDDYPYKPAFLNEQNQGGIWDQIKAYANEIEREKSEKSVSEFGDEPSEVIELDYNYMEKVLKDIIDKNISLTNESQEGLTTEQIASLILSGFNDIDVTKIDSKELAKVVKKIRKDFRNNKNENESEIKKVKKIETNEQLEFGVRYQAVFKKNELGNKDIFYTKSISILDSWYEKLNNNNNHQANNKKGQYVFEYKSSDKLNRNFSIDSIDNKKYLQALKSYGEYVWKNAKFGIAGAAVGVGIAAIIPTSTFVASATGVVTFARLAYSTLKFGNNIYSKIKGQPTKIDRMIVKTKDNIKKLELPRIYIDEDDEETIKFSETKIYKGIKKINDFLKKPSVQWFINGMALGYRIGDALDLNEKIQDFFKKSETSIVDVPNETLNLQTEPKEPTTPSTRPNSTESMPMESTPIETTPIETTPSIEPTNTTDDYSWLDIGKEGDKIDLSGMKQGYSDSYAARGAYTGKYEHLNEAVDLASKYATEANGTFISEIRLPDGNIFKGNNIGELMEMGVDPSKCAANICNSNGNYAWANLEDVLDIISQGTSRGR